METNSTLPSGRAVNWTYLFSSPSAKRQIGLMIEDNGKVSRFDSPSYAVYRKAVDDFADSDAVVAEAVKQGLIRIGVQSSRSRATDGGPKRPSALALEFSLEAVCEVRTAGTLLRECPPASA